MSTKKQIHVPERLVISDKDKAKLASTTKSITFLKPASPAAAVVESPIKKSIIPKLESKTNLDDSLNKSAAYAYEKGRGAYEYSGDVVQSGRIKTQRIPEEWKSKKVQISDDLGFVEGCRLCFVVSIVLVFIVAIVFVLAVGIPQLIREINQMLELVAALEQRPRSLECLNGTPTRF